MRYTIVRYNLDKVYRYSEYNETVEYAKKNLEVEGVREQLQKLNAERDAYNQDIKNITEPEKENEEKKYQTWEEWHKRKNLCVYITIGLAVITIIDVLFGSFLPSVLQTIMTILGMFLIIMIPASVVMKVGESICENSYNKFRGSIENKILIRSQSFAEYARKCYAAIDDLYLLSLEPAHREMVMMRREQAKHHKEVMRMERERMELEKERIRLEKERQAEDRLAREDARRESEKTRRVQERLLEIEQDREIRRKSY